MINKINKTLSTKVYNNFVPNYKTIASVYSIFQDALPVKDRVLLEENIVEQMSSSAQAPNDIQQPLDALTYHTFVSKFNEEYAELLSENQKNLLSNYISSFVDNGIELKLYLNEEIARLKEGLQKAKNISEISSDEILKKKLEEVYNVLDNTKNKQIDTETVEIVLNTQQLLEELESNDY